jgi:hypothetical protein
MLLKCQKLLQVIWSAKQGEAFYNNGELDNFIQIFQMGEQELPIASGQ